MALLALVAGCGSSPETSVLLTVENGVTMVPAFVVLDVLGAKGALTARRRLPAPGTQLSFPGTINVLFSDDAGKVRFVATALSNGGVRVATGWTDVTVVAGT